MTDESADFLYCDEVLEYESSETSSDQSNSAIDSSRPAPNPVRKKVKKTKVYIPKKKKHETPPDTPSIHFDLKPVVITESPSPPPFNVDDFFA